MKQYCNVLILEVTGGLSHYKLVKDLIEKISKKKNKKKTAQVRQKSDCTVTSETPHGKTNNLHRQKQRRRSKAKKGENKGADQVRGNREADQRLG